MMIEILAGSSFAIAAWQDWKKRLVSDWVWLPASAALIISVLSGRALNLITVWLLFSLLCYILYLSKILKLGGADIIAITMLASFPLLNFIVVIAANTLSMIYLVAKKNKGRTAPFCTFLALSFFAIMPFSDMGILGV